jgi:hypothetical protein
VDQNQGLLPSLFDDRVGLLPRRRWRRDAGGDVLAEALGDPNQGDQVSATVGDTKIVGRILLGVSIITIVARCGQLERSTDMWLAILSFLDGPVIEGLIDAYQAKLKAGNIDSKIAAGLAGSEIAAQTLETQSLAQLKIAEIGHPWEPEKVSRLCRFGVLCKCVVGDKILGLGTTPSLQGDTLASGPASSCRSILVRAHRRRRADHQALTLGILKR